MPFQELPFNFLDCLDFEREQIQLPTDGSRSTDVFETDVMTHTIIPITPLSISSPDLQVPFLGAFEKELCHGYILRKNARTSLQATTVKVAQDRAVFSEKKLSDAIKLSFSSVRRLLTFAWGMSAEFIDDLVALGDNPNFLGVCNSNLHLSVVILFIEMQI